MPLPIIAKHKAIMVKPHTHSHAHTPDGYDEEQKNHKTLRCNECLSPAQLPELCVHAGLGQPAAQTCAARTARRRGGRESAGEGGEGHAQARTEWRRARRPGGPGGERARLPPSPLTHEAVALLRLHLLQGGVVAAACLARGRRRGVGGRRSDYLCHFLTRGRVRDAVWVHTAMVI